MNRWAALGAGLVAASALTACGDGAAGGTGRTVVTSFYPLQYVTERIAGDRAEVTALTPPGAEPHDVELTPRDVGRVTDATLVVHLGGLQPSVDQAVANQAKDRALDVAEAARLDLVAEPHEHEDGAEHGEDEARDPHFWLDPQRLADVAAAITDRLVAGDPEGEPSYRANLDRLRADLTALDEEFRTGLTTCDSRDLVTAHSAFGYLAARYGLNQRGINGISPDREPAPADLAAITDFVRAKGVRTIYTETLVSPAIARTVAGETGARLAVLDPVEGITDASPGDDYLAVMRANLAALREGQQCH